MLKNAIKLFKDEEGATAVEYGLIVAAIAGVIIAVVLVLGNKLKNNFNKLQSALP
jgi:pilus assembly protein Flp/PilA